MKAFLAAAAIAALAFAPAAGAQTGGDANTFIVNPESVNVVPKVCSGTITTGGTPQVGIPALPARHGYLIQNQSTGPLYIRSVGAAGSLAATQDQSSYRIDAGVTYSPSHVSDYAYSIVGATTAQAFHCNYW